MTPDPSWFRQDDCYEPPCEGRPEPNFDPVTWRDFVPAIIAVIVIVLVFTVIV